jgi:hypothetical protein
MRTTLSLNSVVALWSGGGCERDILSSWRWRECGEIGGLDRVETSTFDDHHHAVAAEVMLLLRGSDKRGWGGTRWDERSMTRVRPIRKDVGRRQMEGAVSKLRSSQIATLTLVMQPVLALLQVSVMYDTAVQRHELCI